MVIVLLPLGETSVSFKGIVVKWMFDDIGLDFDKCQPADAKNQLDGGGSEHNLGNFVPAGGYDELNITKMVRTEGCCKLIFGEIVPVRGCSELNHRVYSINCVRN